MTDKEAMNVASQCRATASADLCKNILVDGGSGFLFELLLDAAKAIETLAQEKALQALHSENERLGLYKDAYAEQEPVGEVSGHDWSTGLLYRDLEPGTPLYTHPPQRKTLTDDQIYEMYNEPRSDAEMLVFARAIEAAHGIKENT